MSTSPMNKGKLLEAVTDTLRELTDVVPYQVSLDDPSTADAMRLSRAHHALYSEYLKDDDGNEIGSQEENKR